MVKELSEFKKRFNLKKPTIEQKTIIASALREELLRRKDKIIKEFEKFVDYSEDGNSITFFIDLPSGETIAEAYLRRINNESIDLQQISVGRMNSDTIFRNLGIGAMFIKKIFEYCVKNRIKRLTLKVDLDNIKALKLYKKLGFSIIKEDDDFYYMTKNLY